MKSLFDTSVREELAQRINSLTPESKAQWGKMNVFQMLRHCVLCDEMFFGKLNIKRVFIGRLLGKMILKKILKDDKPFGRNAPTAPILKITDNGDIEQEKKAWIKSLEGYTNYTNNSFVHPFFGPMTIEQVGYFAYKHVDHHLRQFGA